MINKVIYFILGILITIFVIIYMMDIFSTKQYVLSYKTKNKINIITINTNQLKKDKLFNKIKEIYKNNSNLIEQDINSKIKEYLDTEKIDKYSINSNNIILLKGKYKVGIPDPYDELSVLTVVDVKDKCVATIKTSSYFTQITVISDNSCQEYANELKDKTIEEGKKYKNMDIIWYTFSKKIITNENS